ncbi:Leu/Ile/Val-binding protein [compost metagenome]
MTFYADPRNLSTGKEVIEEFRAGGYEPESYTLFAYASLQALAAAFAGAGTTDGVKASEWLKTHSVDTVLGTKSWDEKGDLKESPYVMYEWDANGHYKQI